MVPACETAASGLVDAAGARLVGQNDQLDLADPIVVELVLVQEPGPDRERPIGVLGHQQGQHLVLVLEAPIELGHCEHELVGREIVAIRGALGVVTLMTGV